ncbi:MAG TPA: hypothetical protein VFQ54_02905 [Thermomicrobiales bacterium]|nr:hypothetical protein [Thermomicrobiales bacterium]
MAVTLPNHLERQLRELIEQGTFEDPEDVLEHAFALLSEESRNTRLKAALAESAQDVAEGRTAPLTPELITRLTAEAAEMVRKGVRPDPDVAF